MTHIIQPGCQDLVHRPVEHLFIPIALHLFFQHSKRLVPQLFSQGLHPLFDLSSLLSLFLLGLLGPLSGLFGFPFGFELSSRLSCLVRPSSCRRQVSRVGGDVGRAPILVVNTVIPDNNK